MGDDSREPMVFSGPVATGMYVEVELVSRSGETERLSFTIVPDEQADFAAGFLGAGTPLAKAILGQVAGSELPYRVDDIRAVRVLAVATGQTAAEDVAARRKAVIRDAVNKSDFINAMIFASAVNTKWGNYDVDGLDPTTWADET